MEGRTTERVEVVTTELVAEGLRKAEGRLALGWPRVVQRLQSMERDADGEGDHRVERPRLEGAEVDVREFALPELAQGHLLGIEAKAEAAWIADGDAAVADAAAAAGHLRHIGHAELLRLTGEPERVLGAHAAFEVGPERFDLLRRIALQDVGPQGLSTGPIVRHDDARVEALRGTHVEVEPVLLQPRRGVDQVERAGARRFLAVEVMAGDAAEAFLADHLIARVLGFLNVTDRRQRRLLQLVYLTEEADQRSDVRLAELRHRRLDVGARAMALQEGAFESRGRQLGPDV